MTEFNPDDFWEKSDYADESYVDVPLTDELLASIENELGYKLPRTYVELARTQNGGIPKRTNHRTTEPTSWAEDHVAFQASLQSVERKHMVFAVRLVRSL